MTVQEKLAALYAETANPRPRALIEALEIETIRTLHGGSASEGPVWINHSEKAVLLASGYSTVRNGWAADIEVRAHEALIQTGKGSPEDFATYRAVSVSDAERYCSERGITPKVFS